ncbi:uncharacterized protein LOC113294394 isoform X2 [Papaver somniferum]|uniref:uncharacterized protein LOC113294394 isoform X2 n=1 Tax=Papaver somniferum TaxID=3469 RepID=UPI000E705262|nr:uncharacterized protein LOC113294394 isoform X2 [Papaver somniferum]
MIAAGSSSKCTQLILKRMKFFTSEGATIAVPRPSQKNSPNSVQADFYATTFFVVLMDVKRDVTEVLAHQLQVESSVFEVLLWESNIILVDIEVQEMLLGVHTMLDSELLDFVLGCLWASQGELVVIASHGFLLHYMECHGPTLQRNSTSVLILENKDVLKGWGMSCTYIAEECPYHGECQWVFLQLVVFNIHMGVVISYYRELRCN